MTQVTQSPGVLMGADALEALPVWNGDNRAEGIPGTMATPAALGAILKELAGRTTAELDAETGASVAVAVDTVKGSFLMSPSGHGVYVMRETSRTIKGRKWRGLSCVRVIPAGEVIALRVF